MSSPTWYALFDTGERDHVVDLIFAKDSAVLPGLTATLVPMLDAYCRDNAQNGISIDIEAALELKSVVLEASQILGRNLSDDDQRWVRDWVETGIRPTQKRRDFIDRLLSDVPWQSFGNRIRDAWTKFIAAGAGHLQYSEKPKQREARAKGGKAASESKKTKTERVVAEAVRRFDPGSDSGLSNSARARIIKAKAQAAKTSEDAPFPDADELPVNLRKVLSKKKN